MYAASKGHLEVVKLLLSHNADVEAKTVFNFNLQMVSGAFYYFYKCF